MRVLTGGAAQRQFLSMTAMLLPARVLLSMR